MYVILGFVAWLLRLKEKERERKLNYVRVQVILLCCVIIVVQDGSLGSCDNFDYYC